MEICLDRVVGSTSAIKPSQGFVVWCKLHALQRIGEGHCLVMPLVEQARMVRRWIYSCFSWQAWPHSVCKDL